jgi:hypothetical protein
VADVTVKVAGVPLNRTADAPVKFEPLMVTVAPSAPLEGAKLVIFGVAVKLAALVVVPAGVVTLSGPLVAVTGTVAWMVVSEDTENVAALAPLKVTAVAPVKLAPVIVTTVPPVPLVGVKLVIVGREITVKLAVLVAVPAGVVTLTGPVVAVAGTVAWMVVSEVTENVVAFTPLNVTAVAPVKLAPVIVTVVPLVPLVGEKLVIVGPGIITVKLAALVAVPAAVVTLRGPVVAVAGTVAWIVVSELTENVVAFTPLNLTAVAPVKLAPVIVTVVPLAPLVGEKLVIVGPEITVKLAVLVTVPADPVTRIGPVVAPAGTTACMAVSDVTVKVAGVPLNVTAVTEERCVPLIVTLVPAAPLAGVKPVIVGPLPPPKKAFRIFAVVRWMRASTRPPVLSAPGTSSSAQLQDIVPDANTQAPLGA